MDAADRALAVSAPDRASASTADGKLREFRDLLQVTPQTFRNPVA